MLNATRIGSFVFRILAYLAGVGVLAAVTHNLIVDGPGYDSPRATAYLTISIAIAISAMGVGYATSRGMTGKAWGLAFGILAFEMANLVFTAERVIMDRDAQQRPVRQAERKIGELDAQLVRLRSELKVASTSARLTKALEDQRHATTAVTVKSAERGCASNCRKLLQAQSDAAANEVALARSEITKNVKALQIAISHAEKLRSNIKMPASGSPLADRIGIAPWVVDLTVAGLMSIAGNMVACILIALATHTKRSASLRNESVNTQNLNDSTSCSQLHVKKDVNAQEIGCVKLIEDENRISFGSNVNTQNNNVDTSRVNAQAGMGCVTTFLSTAIVDCAGSKMLASDALLGYKNWCEHQNLRPVEDLVFLRDLAALTRQKSLSCEKHTQDIMVVGITLKAA